MKTILIAGALSLAMMFPAFAQDAQPCASVEMDKEKSERQGLHWLGVRAMPFSSSQAVFYESGGRVVFSPIIDGCVSRDVYPAFAAYQAETAA